MKITLRIKRYNPETDQESRFEDFELDVEPTDRVLDALMFVKRNLDGTLGLRKSCAHGVCGSDAMLINGTEQLACKTLVKDVAEEEGAVVTVEPLRSMPVLRDLIVDQHGFFDQYRTVKPYLVPAAEPPAGKEFRQSQDERKQIDDQTKCILCASCYSSCPVVAESDQDFIGPAAVVQAARFAFDSRDKGVGERLDVLDAENGVWPCESHFNCTKVCPRGIKVTKHINLTKRAVKAQKEAGDQDS